MTDNYMVTLDEISKDIKVGNKATFNGACGVNIDKIEIFVDGFKIGEAKILPGAGPITWNSWSLEYAFTNGGHRSLVLTAKSKGEVISNRFHKFEVESEVVVKPVEKPSDYKLKIVDSEIRHAVRWEGRLIGLICHYDAGAPSKDPTGLLEWGKEKGYTFWAMTTEGVVHRTTGNNEFGYNVGMERHRDHIGVEISNPGKLRMHNGRWHPWYHWNQETGKFIEGKQPWPEDQVRYFKGSKTQVEGYYAKFTDAQEKALVGLVQYLKNASPSFKIDNVVDHSECMAEKGWYGVKQDVGGSLSMTMPEFREYLKKVIV